MWKGASFVFERSCFIIVIVWMKRMWMRIVKRSWPGLVVWGLRSIAIMFAPPINVARSEVARIMIVFVFMGFSFKLRLGLRLRLLSRWWLWLEG